MSLIFLTGHSII